MKRRHVSASALAGSVLASFLSGVARSETALVPIARWDAVPYQRISPGEPLNVAVVAFSKDGIARVEFSFHRPQPDSPYYTPTSNPVVSEMTLNPQTGAYEYWTSVSVDDFDGDGQIDMEAMVYGKEVLGVPGIRDKTNGGLLGLGPLLLNINKSGSLPRPRTYWVDAESGLDNTPNDGSRELPYKTLVTAMKAIVWRDQTEQLPSDGAVIRLRPGVYPVTTPHAGWDMHTKCTHEWLTITTDGEGGHAGNTVIEGREHGWPTIHNDGALIRLKGLTIRQPEDWYPTLRFSEQDIKRVTIWFDSCRLEGTGQYPTYPPGQNPGEEIAYYQNPYDPLSLFKCAYLTDTLIQDVSMAVSGGWLKLENLAYPLLGAQLCRNLEIKRISDDAFQNVPLVINCQVEDVNPWEGPWLQSQAPHADAWQHFGGNSQNQVDNNVIVYGLRGTNLKYQGLFIRPDVGNLNRNPDTGACESSSPPADFAELPAGLGQFPAEGMAFVNVYLEMSDSAYAPVGWAGASDWSRAVNHLLWWNCTFHSTTSIPRGMTIYRDEEIVVDDQCNTQKFDFTITDMSVVGCDFARLGGGQPVVDDSGWQHNHFVYPNDGTTKGTQFTTGDNMLNTLGVPTFGSPLLRRFDSAETVSVDADGKARRPLADVGAYQWSPAWVQRSPSVSPSARKDHAMASHEKVILFGGWTASGDDGHTWEWDGIAQEWTQKYSIYSPPAQHGHAMGACGPPTIAGLYNNQMYNWVWRGNTWSLHSMLAGPRQFGAMTTDSAGINYLFGGLTPDQQAAVLGDMWMFAEDLLCEQLNLDPAPAARYGHAMDSYFDPTKAPAILFGGSDGQSFLGDTWAFLGADIVMRTSFLTALGQTDDSDLGSPILLGGGGEGGWAQLSPVRSPSPRFKGRIAAGVLFGGYGPLEGGGEGYLGDTWAFVDGENPTWLPVTDSGPSPRYGHAMSFDQSTGTVVLFGGETAPGVMSAETWELDLNSW